MEPNISDNQNNINLFNNNLKKDNFVPSNSDTNYPNNWELVNQINILRSEIGFLTKMMMSFISEDKSRSKKHNEMEKEVRKLKKEIQHIKKKLKNYNENQNNHQNNNLMNSYQRNNYNKSGKSKIIEKHDMNPEIIVQIEPIDFSMEGNGDQKIIPYDNKSKNLNNSIMFNPFDKIFDMIFKKVKDNENQKENKTEEDNESEEDIEIDNNIEIEELDIEIKSIDDLIKLSDLYLKKKNEIDNEETNNKNRKKAKEILTKFGMSEEEIKDAIKEKEIKVINKNSSLYELNGKLYPINLETIHKLALPLKKLKSMIGLNKVKDSILDMILYYVQNFEKNNKNMLHTVIEGPPGVGKTELGRIIAEIYASMGVIKSNKFKIVRRTDLIGEYVGHTAHKTQRAIDEANGGVLFIDEAYSLGSNEGKDSFSKECIDTINQNLSEQKKNLIVIIAGYPNELEKCFFSYNPGLNRRFPFRYSIDGYNETELKDIFMKKLNDIKWKLGDNVKDDFIINFFKNNLNKFGNYGGDIENLITMCKFCHSRRIIGKHPNNKKKLTSEDILNGMKKFMDMNKSKHMDKLYFNNMYL